MPVAALMRAVDRLLPIAEQKCRRLSVCPVQNGKKNPVALNPRTFR